MFRETAPFDLFFFLAFFLVLHYTLAAKSPAPSTVLPSNGCDHGLIRIYT